jgi:hypothetical protein
VLIFDSPKSDVFLAARNQLISLYWTELYGENIKIADLLGN